MHSIRARNIEASIANYLSGTPLTVQSIAFNIDKNELLGELGMQSVLTKTVGVNNKTEYDYTAGIDRDHYSVKYCAKKLGLKEV